MNKGIQIFPKSNKKEDWIEFLIEKQILPCWSGEGVYFKPVFIKMNEERAKYYAKLLGVSNREECKKLRNQIKNKFYFSRKLIKKIMEDD